MLPRRGGRGLARWRGSGDARGARERERRGGEEGRVEWGRNEGGERERERKDADAGAGRRKDGVGDRGDGEGISWR